MAKINRRKNNQVKVLSISAIVAIVIIVGIIVIAINTISRKNNSSNNTNTSTAESQSNINSDDSQDSSNQMSNEDIQEIENLYLQVFIAYNDDSNTLLDMLSSEFKIKSQDNSMYPDYIEDYNASLYLSDDFNTAINELFGQENRRKVLSTAAYDSTNKVYVTHYSTDQKSYKITSVTNELIDNNTAAVFSVEYYDYTAEDLNKYEAEYLSSHDTSKYAMGEGVSPELYEEIEKSFKTDAPKTKLKIKVSINPSFTYSKYKLISISKE